MLVKWQSKWQWIVYYLTNQFTSLNLFIMSNSTLKLTSDQVQLLSQMFGDLASLDYDDKYNDDFGSDVFNQLWDKVTNL
jgi:hypothetical protein